MNLLCSTIQLTLSRIASLEEFYVHRVTSQLSTSAHLDDTYVSTKDEEDANRKINNLISVTVMLTVGRLFLEEGRFTEAEVVTNEVLSLFKDVYGPKHPRNAVAVMTLAACCMVSHPARLREAQQHNDIALALISDAFGDASFIAVSPGGPLQLKMQILEMQGLVDQAAEVALFVMCVRSDVFGKSHPATQSADQALRRLVSLTTVRSIYSETLLIS